MVRRRCGTMGEVDSHAMFSMLSQLPGTRGARVIRIGCATLAALMVLLLLSLYIGAVRRQAWREAHRDDIYEAVFRHQMRYLDRHLSPRPTRYYLAVRLGDPGDQFMRRFRDLGPRVESVAVAWEFCGRAFPHRAVGTWVTDQAWRKMQERPEQAGVLISLDEHEKIDPMHWSPDGTRAYLFGFWGRETVQDESRRYEIERRDGGWVVTRDTPAG